jgi:hypothetical protein
MQLKFDWLLLNQENFNYVFNFWDNFLQILSIGVSVVIAIWVHKLSKQVNAKTKFDHEIFVTEAIKKIPVFTSIILANSVKHSPLNQDFRNKNYSKQGAELHTIVPGFGVRVILRPTNEVDIPVGIIPFEWIEYVRDYDWEDQKPVIVCKFKGVKWYKSFKSPFIEVKNMIKNPHYIEGSHPPFMIYKYK